MIRKPTLSSALEAALSCVMVSAQERPFSTLEITALSCPDARFSLLRMARRFLSASASAVRDAMSEGVDGLSAAASARFGAPF